MNVIQPTVGRVVWYRPGEADSDMCMNGADEPLAAIVTAVHGDRCVNLAVFEANGAMTQRSSVTLMQPGDDAAVTPSFGYCEWMPYQVGQAVRNEELEQKMAESFTTASGGESAGIDPDKDAA